MNSVTRLQRLRETLNQTNLDGVLVTHLPNVRYLTGFTGSNGICLVTPTNAIFVTDGRYSIQAREEVTTADLFIANNSLFEELKENALFEPGKRIGFESQRITYAQYQKLQELFPQVTWQPLESLVDELRIVKDDEEIAAIRRAASLTDQILGEIVPLLRQGVRELDIAAEIEYRCKRNGAEGVAFEPIVASGERSALPHATASEKKMAAGELLVIDFGCKVQGYCSDITRTFAFSPISEEQIRIYKTVQKAQELAVATIRAGVPCGELDQIARDVIASEGFGQYFPHSLGHGLGLEVHSLPRVSNNNPFTLPEKTVITVEPGIYVSGVGGVRIEDDILVLSESGQRLTNFSRELTIVGE